MGVLSKLLVDTLGLRIHRATCYEMVHTWNPDCYGAIADSLRDGWLFSFKTYIIVYGLTSIFSVKDIREIRWRKILTDSVRSSFFLMTNLIIFLWLMCQFRKMLGFFTVPTLGLTSGLISALLAIWIENRRRRPLLALYLTNLASETAYHQLVNHGYLRYIPNGTVVIFGIGLAGLLHLYCRDKLHISLRKSIECPGRQRSLRIKMEASAHDLGKNLKEQVSRCGYSWCTNQTSPLSFCGAVGGLSLFFYPNISIAMYVFWKFVEGLFFSYYKKLVIPYGDIILYALSTSYIAWNAVIEPHTLRDGYWKFLVGLTGNRIELLNRQLFDIFGYNSSKKFPGFVPKLDPNFSSIHDMCSVASPSS
uniref:Transmembrane protein 135 N-terminal domain-containing protein n=1 Tax=Setaria digitata TaxID=48799 RepID=A0A915PKA9_9BILA